MAMPRPPDDELARAYSSRLLDVLIRAGFIAILAALCYVVFAPFLTLMVWAIILAVTLYPLHKALAHRIGGRQGFAATLVVLAGGVLIVAPTALLLNSFGSSLHEFIGAVQNNTVQVPPPPESIKGWPIVGDNIYGNGPRFGEPSLHLHARELMIPLSKNKPPVVVTAPIPEHLRERLKACGWNEA